MERDKALEATKNSVTRLTSYEAYCESNPQANLKSSTTWNRSTTYVECLMTTSIMVCVLYGDKVN